MFRNLIVGSFLVAIALLAEPAVGQTTAPERKPAATPWGISASASSFQNHAEWFPKMAEAGVTSVRLFPEWRTFEPKPNT